MNLEEGTTLEKYLKIQGVPLCVIKLVRVDGPLKAVGPVDGLATEPEHCVHPECHLLADEDQEEVDLDFSKELDP